jgi:glycogen debranching enzyme
VKVHDRSDQSRRQAAAWIEAFAGYLDTACLGHVSEIADADWPHTPRGCVAQAWSVAELLRAAVEDVYDVAPIVSRNATSLETRESKFSLVHGIAIAAEV